MMSGVPIHEFERGLLCSAGMAHPTMAWGRNREVFLVIGLTSSRTESPQGWPAAIQEPSAA